MDRNRRRKDEKVPGQEEEIEGSERLGLEKKKEKKECGKKGGRQLKEEKGEMMDRERRERGVT